MSSNGRDCLNLTNVYVIDEIPVKRSSVDLSEYSHLIDIPVSFPNSDVDILIGQDNCEALVPLQVRKGGKGEPFAVRSILGWTLNGPSLVSQAVGRSVVSHFITTKSIEQQVQDLWKIENEGLSVKRDVMSVDDRKVLKL